MRDDEEVERFDTVGPAFAVSPVGPRTRVPRAALLGVAVGVAAFVAGIAVASTGPSRTPSPSFALATDRPAATATAAPSPPGSMDPTSGTATQPPGDATTRPPAPGSSAFVAGFDPAALIAGADPTVRCQTGSPRDKEVPRTRRDGPRLTFQRSWVAWCPVAEEDRQAFLLRVFRTLVAAVPAETFGYSASLAGAGDALFPYGERPLAGTVAVTADDAGRGVAIAIVVSEWRVDVAP